MRFYLQEEMRNSKLQVLLIDDALATGSKLKCIIKEVGCADFIGQAQRGLAGVEMIQKFMPGLVIIDLYIPGTNGFDLLRWIKETYSKIKVVIISDSLKPEFKQIAESLGADYFLDKQTELIKIAEIIQAIDLSYYNELVEKN